MSGDTPAVGAEARAVESGMDGWLGRVKERAPGVLRLCFKPVLVD